MTAPGLPPALNLPLAFHLRDAEETEQLGAALGDILRSTAAHSRAVPILLAGDLGAGKTTLTRGIAAGLGADDGAVASPTFTLRMDHHGAERALTHIDAWRIGPDDLESIGWDELLASRAVIAIEWPERIASRLPDRHLRVRLEHAAAPSTEAEGGGADDDGITAGRCCTIDAAGLDPRESRRIAEGLAVLVRAPRITPPCCPICSRPPAGGEAPFCSRRCRMADLGDWLLMRHRIAGSETPEFDE
jgi:tRNA threonylcarbamoyladenosine biosynthesis protein TsaE